MPVPGPATLSMWKSHIEQACSFNGSVAEYCRQNNLKASKFSYYKKRLAKLEAKSFSEIKVSNGPKAPTFPDPLWLAKFLREFLR